jgi:hypothetical protein
MVDFEWWIDKGATCNLHRTARCRFFAGQAKPKGRFPRMITRKQQRAAQERAAQMIRNSGVGIKEEEPKKIEVVDFGLSNLEEEGVQVL